jgi:Tol biopolymer transport system component
MIAIARSGVVAALASAAVIAATPADSATNAGPYRNGLIAYTQCCRPTGIYVIRADGTGSRLVYRAVHDDAPLTPAWAPDGKRLAFVPGASRRGLWVMSASGTARRRITAGRGEALFPSWSPTGKSVVFADADAKRTGRHDLFTVRVDGSGLKRLTGSTADESHPAWAPNGNEIVYERGRDLWRINTDGRSQRLLVRNASSPSWSPGASRFAFIRAGDVWTARRDGIGAVRIVDLPREQIAVTWSPDSRWLVTAPLDRGDLTLVRADGSQLTAITREPEAFHGWPTWRRIPM